MATWAISNCYEHLFTSRFCGYVLSFLLSEYLGAKLLNHGVGLYLVLQEVPRPFLKVMPFYTTANNE